MVMWLPFGMKDSKGKAKELSQWESDLRRREAVRVAVLFPWILAINYSMIWILTEFSILRWNLLGSRISGGGRKLSRVVCFRVIHMVIFHHDSYGTRTINHVFLLTYNSLA